MLQSSTPKRFRDGCDRADDPVNTLERLWPHLSRFGITRVADLTKLDVIGLPVAAAYRPNSRSLSVAQGKGVSKAAAQVSCIMESIETHCAENVSTSVEVAALADLHGPNQVVDVQGLPRLSVGGFSPYSRTLWMRGHELTQSTSMLVPFEMVHLDFRLPLPHGSGSFLMGSNGLASGNWVPEAISHAICELVERDATALWQLSAAHDQAERVLDLQTVDDPLCVSLLQQFDSNGFDVAVWDTTTDIGIASFHCVVVERRDERLRAFPPSMGAGCHPRRSIALIRALTEAAQTRLTIISGARDDLRAWAYNESSTRLRTDRARMNVAPGHRTRSFRRVPDVDNATFEADVNWEIERLASVGIRQVVVVDLSISEPAVSVVRVIVPYLEAMSEGMAYVPGIRARNVQMSTP